MPSWLEEQFGRDLTAYDEFSRPTEFDLLPANTRVLAKVTEASGKVNKNGRPYPAMVLEVVAIPDGLTVSDGSVVRPGHFGRPRLYDNMKLTVPESPAAFAGQPEETVTKKKQAVGIWLRQTRSLGLKPEDAGGELNAESVGQFYAKSIGSIVGVRVGIEAASEDGKYQAKNVVADYEAVTDKWLAKYKLALPSSEVPF